VIRVYINYPNPHITIHSKDDCGFINRTYKSEKRIIDITPQTISDEIIKFRNGDYKFGSTSTINDMWLNIDFGDNDFEKAIVSFIQKLIGRYYGPLRNCQIEEHC